MNRVKRLPHTHVKRASSALPITVGDTNTCENLKISWDASQGKAPWTVLIAPINQLPTTFSIDASGSSFSYNYPVPSYKSTTQVVVGIVDSSGGYAGVSKFFNFVSKTTSCSGPSTSMDFVWFPTSDASPSQCEDWGVTYQTDSANTGIKGDVSFTFLPENGIPFTVDAGAATGTTGQVSWEMAIASGTKFAVAANDQGSSGTGGVGDLYQVVPGSASSCTPQNAVISLPPPSETVSASTLSSSTSSSSSSKTSSRTSSTSQTASSTHTAKPTFSSPQNSSADDSKSNGNTAGKAAGATIGVIAALGIIALLIFCIRRKRRREMNEKGGDPYGVNPNPYIATPWRQSSTPFDASQRNSRTPGWFQRRSQGGEGPFSVLNSPGRSDGMHSPQEYYEPGMHRDMQGEEILRAPPHNRNDFVLSTIASSGIVENDARSSAVPSFGSPNPSQSGHHFSGTVPDSALFPPPPSRIGRATGIPQRSDSSPFDDPAPLHTGVGTFHGIPGDFFDDRSSRYPAGLDSQQVPRSEAVQSPREVISPSSSSTSSQMGARVARKRLSPADAAFAHPITPLQGQQQQQEFLAPIDTGRNSIFDPFNGQSEAAEFSAPLPSAGRRAPAPPTQTADNHPGVTSEVMMMEAPHYRGRVSAQHERNTKHQQQQRQQQQQHDEDDENASLPYL